MEDTSETKLRKRKQRAVLSCNDCRRRKLKCDRELPCNRCIHDGVAEKCAYGKDAQSTEDDTKQILTPKRVRRSSPQRVVTNTSLATPSHDNIIGQESHSLYASSEHAEKDRVTDLEQRIASMETLLSSLQHKPEHLPGPTSQSENAHVGESSGTAPVLFKGRNYRTFYYGPTNPMMVITHVCLT
jgi:hypothetical protein